MPRCWWAASRAGASSILGCRSRNVARRLRAVIMSLYSALSVGQEDERQQA